MIPLALLQLPQFKTVEIAGQPRIMVAAFDSDVPLGGWWLVADRYIPHPLQPQVVTLVAPGWGLVVPWQLEATPWFTTQQQVLPTDPAQRILNVRWTWNGANVTVPEWLYTKELWGNGPKQVAGEWWPVPIQMSENP